jgi:hypothetical protein
VALWFVSSWFEFLLVKHLSSCEMQEWGTVAGATCQNRSGHNLLNGVPEED